jgi:hypothetical protein
MMPKEALGTFLEDVSVLGYDTRLVEVAQYVKPTG